MSSRIDQNNSIWQLWLNTWMRHLNFSSCFTCWRLKERTAQQFVEEGRENQCIDEAGNEIVGVVSHLPWPAHILLNHLGLWVCHCLRRIHIYLHQAGTVNAKPVHLKQMLENENDLIRPLNPWTRPVLVLKWDDSLLCCLLYKLVLDSLRISKTNLKTNQHPLPVSLF